MILPQFNNRQNRQPPPTRQADPNVIAGQILRVELKENLTSGSSADAYILKWNGSTYAVSSSVIEIHDPFEKYSGTARDTQTDPVTNGTRFYVSYFADARRFEIISEITPLGKYKRYRTATETTSPGGSFWTFANTEPADAVYTNPYFSRDGSNQVICNADGWYRVSISVSVYPTNFTTASNILIGVYFVNDTTANVSLDADHIFMPTGTPAERIYSANLTTLENVSAGQRVGVYLSNTYSPVTGETFLHSVKMHVGEKMHNLT